MPQRSQSFSRSRMYVRPPGAHRPAEHWPVLPRSPDGGRHLPPRLRVGVRIKAVLLAWLFGLAGLSLLPLAPLSAGGLLRLPAAEPAAGAPLPSPPRAGPIWVGAGPAPEVAAAHVAILDDESGAILYEKAGSDEVPVASLTKIVTAIVALEQGNLDDQVTADFDPSRLRNSTLMGIQPGDVLSLEDLLYGLMLPSGNDAALAIANYIAGSPAAFAERMNAKMAELGLTQSHFVNPHGLDQPDHYSSVLDMVNVSRYAMANPTFRAIVATRSHTVHTQRGSWTVSNLNQLLGRYPGADGIKIGYVRRSQHTLVASVARDGHRVILALTNTNDYVADAIPLYDWVFASFRWAAGEDD